MMLTYFRELLATLKAIERHLAKLESTVQPESMGHSNGKPYIATGHWNGGG